MVQDVDEERARRQGRSAHDSAAHPPRPRLARAGRRAPLPSRRCLRRRPSDGSYVGITQKVEVDVYLNFLRAGSYVAITQKLR